MKVCAISVSAAVHLAAALLCPHLCQAGPAQPSQGSRCTASPPLARALPLQVGRV